MHFYSPHILSASEDTTPVAVVAKSGLPAILVTPAVTPPTKNRQRNPASAVFVKSNRPSMINTQMLLLIAMP